MQFERVQAAPERVFVLVFDEGDEVMGGLQALAESERLGAAHLTGIGAFRDVVLGFFEPERRGYREIPVAEQVEVLALTGNVAMHEGRPRVHVHVVVGTRDGAARGGHLLRATVAPTLELVLQEAPAHLRRHTDPRTGLALLEATRRMRPALHAG